MIQTNLKNLVQHADCRTTQKGVARPKWHRIVRRTGYLLVCIKIVHCII